MYCITHSELHQPSSIYIKSGNFSENRENIKYVRAIHIHPEFILDTMENDIALLQVNKNYLFNSKIYSTKCFN